MSHMLLVTIVSESKVLKIFIDDPGPEAVMLRHGFSEDQKQWARVLVDSMIDDQTQGESDAGYISGTDFGAWKRC